VIAVCNASPLITLAKLGLLSLLSELFGKVHLADEVFQEVVVAGAGRPAAATVSSATWIQVHPCSNPALLRQWQQQHNLGPGEAATVLLAQSLSADLIVMDERAARLFAQGQGLKVVGCVALLEISHRRGLVPDLRMTYQQMLSQGTFIARDILNRSLASFNLPPL